MIDKIGHYSMTTPGTIYDEEALTALELAGRTATKVNECVEQVNENTKTVNEAKDYMVGNLPNFVENEIDELHDSGELTTMLVRAVASGKVDKGGNEQITYNMLGQDVKEAMTGGNTPVVGANSVNTSNIVNESVTGPKLAPSVQDIVVHTSENFYNFPLLTIDTQARTATVTNKIDAFYIYGPAKTVTVTVANITVDSTTYLNAGAQAISIYFDDDTNVIYVCEGNYHRVEMYNRYCLGIVNSNKRVNTLHLPIILNGVFLNGRGHENYYKTPNAIKPVSHFIQRYPGKTDTVVFNIDTATKTASVVMGGTYSFFIGNGHKQINFNTVTYDTTLIADNTAGLYYVYFDELDQAIKFTGTLANVPAHYLFMGMVNTGAPHTSTMIIPFSVDNEYLYFPNEEPRRNATLIYRPWHYHMKTVPYIDYRNLKLVFPSCRYLYLATNNNLINIVNEGGSDNDYVLDLLGGYNFICAGANGLKTMNYDEFIDFKRGCHKDTYFYLGCICAGDHHAFLNFEVEEGTSLSVLGDSISTMAGYVPEGNPTYYNDTVEKIWWNMVMRRCGMYRNTINAYSGLRVTPTADAVHNGVAFANKLDNGTEPDNIIVYLGVNDFNNEVPLGTYDGKGAIPSDLTTFRAAYANMLNTILATYKKSKVYACTLPACEVNDSEKLLPEHNDAGVYLFEYNEAIRELATRFHVEVIDLATCAMNAHNGPVYFWDYDTTDGDFLHPTTAGQKAIADKVVQAVYHQRHAVY